MRKGGLCWLLGATTLLLLVTRSQGQASAAKGQNPCVSKTTCSECIQTRTCAWCSDPISKEQKRCFQPNNNLPSTCPEEYIWNPSNEYRILKSRSLQKASKTTSSSSHYFNSSNSSSFSHHEAVQISPQHISLKLRINEAYKFNLGFAQAEDYPVDLYYLMDLSKSMEDDKEKLSDLGDLLAESMQNLTSNFRLGFGSFVDKVVMPYVSTVPKNLIEPCTGCKAPYGFTNIMRLSTDTSTFAGEVRRAAVSGNLDAPEGGFDAIMQAVVCREKIGWRERARRLLVFSTDAGFHYAGDGKLGGIVKPNDGLCHLDNYGMYTHSTIQDYPSISQINLKVKQNAINVIFAVEKSQIDVYERLRDHVEGSTAGKLTGDSSNVVDLVKEQYNLISSSVELKDTASSAVKVTYHSGCLDGAGPVKQTNQCDGLKVGTVVNFTVEVEVTQCPANKKDWKQQLKIYPVGINESLIVDLEMLCDCPCENKGHPGYKEKSARCNGFGTEMCGKCKCDSKHFGQFCECDSDNSFGSIKALAGCRPDNTSLVDCSGQGICICGQCECHTRSNPLEVISGQFCECDDFSCDYEDGQLCSGPEHGVCVCGKCQCKTGWTGPSCKCRDSIDTCIQPGKTEVCSGKGDCVCGHCECIEAIEGGVYQGKYCERYPVSPRHCAEFKDCVRCQMYQTGPLANEDDCALNCTTFVPIAVDEAIADENKQEVVCTYFDEDDDCRYAYVYGYDEEGKLVIRALKERDCPAPVYVLGIVLGVIGAIVLIGLALLLLWKLLTTIHDRREFAKFEKERMMAKWDTGENPIYKQATSTFKNPTYKGK